MIPKVQNARVAEPKSTPSVSSDIPVTAQAPSRASTVKNGKAEVSPPRDGEPNFDAIDGNLPSFVAGDSAHTSENQPAKHCSKSSDDPFAQLPEFQTVEAPVHQRGVADEEFQRLMMAQQQPSVFPTNANQNATAQPPVAKSTANRTPTPDHTNIAGVLNSFDNSIQHAVAQQRVANERAVKAKFTVAQIKAAFTKPMGDVKRLRGLRVKQLQTALLAAAVPMGFLGFVVFGSFGLVLTYRSWLYGDSIGIVNPMIGLPFIVACIVVLACWLPALSLVFSGLALMLDGRRKASTATQLTRKSQPVMYEFVDQICDKLGSPKPGRIDLDCEFNASASLGRGWLSGRNDLVLTMGIPLIATQNTEQLASVIAHEFGHFRQGGAMRASYLTGCITEWFVTSAQAGFGTFYWFAYLTHLLSGALSREMEWDADRHAVHLAGTKAFVESSANLERFGVAYHVTMENLFGLFQSGALVDNIPRLMVHIGRTMPASVIREIAEATEQQRQDRFDTHPPTRDRVNAARKLNQLGVLSLNRPATDLIDHWTPLCKKITKDFYAEKLELEPDEIQDEHLTPLEDLLRDEHKLLMDMAEKGGQ